MRQHRRWVSVWFACAGCALVVACGSKSGLKDAGSGVEVGPVDGGSPGSGGRPGSGGATGGGGGATGGNPGSGGATADASPGVTCTDDGGIGLPAAARRCTQDGDCTIAIAPKCCGPDLALGEASSQSATYAACLAPPAGGCVGLGCAKYLGYLTDTGRVTPAGAQSPIAAVSVHCLHQLCTTDVIGADAATDAPVVDAAPEVAPPGCGDAGPCGPAQACVLVSGGTRPPCSAPSDAGTCPVGQVLGDCYDPGTSVPRQPGCTTPAPTPHCAQLADGCGDPCACACPAGGGGGCYPGPGYTICAMP